MNTGYNGMDWICLSRRLAIYTRDGWCCVYCGAQGEDLGVGLSLDHILPNGDNDTENLLTSCGECNSSKGDRTMRSWFQTLRDRGENTTKLSAKIRRHRLRKIDRKTGRQLAAIRRPNSQRFARYRVEEPWEN